MSYFFVELSSRRCIYFQYEWVSKHFPRVKILEMITHPLSPPWSKQGQFTLLILKISVLFFVKQELTFEYFQHLESQQPMRVENDRICQKDRYSEERYRHNDNKVIWLVQNSDDSFIFTKNPKEFVPKNCRKSGLQPYGYDCVWKSHFEFLMNEGERL